LSYVPETLSILAVWEAAGYPWSVRPLLAVNRPACLMAHSSIQVTVDIYGHLIPGANVSFVDKLDAPTSPQHSRNKDKVGIRRSCRSASE
jgi:hypothetical protein